MSSDDVTTVFAVLAIAGSVLVVGLVVGVALPATRPALLERMRGQGLPLAWLAATVATLGSLYLSEVADFPPCRLCWFQRIAVYPLVVVLGLGWLRRDTSVRLYGLALAGLGLAVNLWHVAVEVRPSLEGSGVRPAEPVLGPVGHPARVLDHPPYGHRGLRPRHRRPGPRPARAAPVRPVSRVGRARLAPGGLMSTTPRKGRPAPASRTASARTGPAVPLFAIGVAALVVIVIGAVVAIGLTGGDDEGGGGSGEVAGGDQAFGPVSVTGTVLEPLADGGTDPAVGQPAPVLDGETPTGDAITVDPSEGPMVIAFLAHWCPHCQSEVPRLVELADAQGEVNGVELVAVATRSDDRRPEFPPGEWLAGEDWPGRVMVDSDAPPDEAPAALAAYGVSSFPFLVAVDADGEVVARAAGEQGADGLEALFEAARAGGGEAGGTSDEGSDVG